MVEKNRPYLSTPETANSITMKIADSDKRKPRFNET